MSDVSISYKGAEIASLDDSGTKRLLTSGKYCEDDIEVAYTKPSGGGGMQSYDVVITATINNSQQLFNMLVPSPQDNHVYVFQLKSSANDTLYNLMRAGMYCSLTKYVIKFERAIRYRNGNTSSQIGAAYDAAVTVGDVYTVWYSEVY